MGRPLDETELVARAQRGNIAAYEELTRMYQGIAFQIAYLIAGSVADAEEAAQDGFVKAFRALGRFRRGRPFRPWLLAIVANEARNRRLRAASENRPGDAAPSPEAAVLALERRSLLLDAVNRLSEEHRLVVSCRYFLGLTENETAAALGIRRGTVRSRLSRALERLREEVPEDA